MQLLSRSKPGDAGQLKFPEGAVFLAVTVGLVGKGVRAANMLQYSACYSIWHMGCELPALVIPANCLPSSSFIPILTRR